MAGRRPFALVYDSEVKNQLRVIEPEYRGLIRTTIEEQLRFGPDKETRNRKPLQRPVTFEAAWAKSYREPSPMAAQSPSPF